MGKPTISVVVLTWNGIHYLAPCLESLLAQDGADLEIIVVDNGSTDGTPDLMAERYPGVRLIRNERNLGFAAGNNIGLRAAAGDLMVLLNVDTEVHPGWLAALVAAFEDPATGIVGCKLLYPDGTIQHAGAYLYGPRGESAHVGRFAQDDGRFDKLIDSDFVTGAAIAIRRQTLEQIGFLDESFAPIYYEDVDWCYRARAAGFRVVYQSQAVVTHHESTTSTEFSYWRKFALNQGRIRFLFKNLPLERLLHESGPAELAWVSSLDRTTELMAARGAYLKTLIELPGILAFRGSDREEAVALRGLLADLRAGAIASLEALPDSPPPTRELEPASVVHQETACRQPSAGEGVFDKLRRLWRALHYLDVLPDVVAHLHQHDQTLEKHGQIVGDLAHHAARLEEQIGQQRRILEGQSRDAAENIRELTTLAERIVQLEMASVDLLRRVDGGEEQRAAVD
jgi:GT2 family glycosyltransferase